MPKIDFYTVLARQGLTNFLPHFKMAGVRTSRHFESRRGKRSVFTILSVSLKVYLIFAVYSHTYAVQRYKLKRQSLLFEDSVLLMFNLAIDFVAASDTGVFS